MESLDLNKNLNFKNPEEEIAFLREHIKSQELSKKGLGLESNKVEIAKDAIKEYRSIPVESVLPKDRLPDEKREKEIVLRLKPEPHDSKMEEILGVLISDGLKHAFSLIEKINNPHIDDDFERFLVQYLLSTGKIPGLKENNRTFKGLNMKLLEVTLPEMDKDENKTFKDFLGAMEQFYAGMQSIARSKENKDQDYFTLEISLSNDTNQIVVFAGIPTNFVDLFEKQVLAFYHNAKVKEVTDDYNIFSPSGASSGAIAKTENPVVLPIKTYESIEADPMNALLNVFSKLKTVGEGAAIQFVIVPSGDRYIKKFNSILTEVKDGVSVKKASDELSKWGSAISSASSELIFGPKKKEEKDKKVDEVAIAKINEKVKSTIMGTIIRIVTSAENKSRSDAILNEVESAFNQFSDSSSNSIVFEKLPDRKLNDLFHSFSYREISEENILPFNLKELASLFHFPVGVSAGSQLKSARAQGSSAPLNMPSEGVLLGLNKYRDLTTNIFMGREDRMRHLYVIGQTGTGKTTILKNMIAQDIKNGDGVCFIDPHGSDIEDILSVIPVERADDVIYFDPAYLERPMGFNMLEYDLRFPEQKTFVINELLAIFNKLFDMKVAGGPAFEQYFRNSAMLVMEDPESGNTLLDIGRVLGDKAYRQMKLERCKNPIIKQFWENAEKTTGDQSLSNYVPYITNKFDVFVSNDIMRPIIAQEKSAFNFRQVMDEKKILLVNLSKGRLGDINSSLIGLILVGKILMAALSRVDSFGKPMNDFYLYIDEFQNVTTDSIATILSEARKYRLSLNLAHQFIGQLDEKIKTAVFGNVGSMALFRVGADDAPYLESQIAPTFTAADIMKLDNFNAYMRLLVAGQPEKPFNIETLPFIKGSRENADQIKQLSYLKYGRPREEIEEEVMAKYKKI